MPPKSHIPTVPSFELRLEELSAHDRAMAAAVRAEFGSKRPTAEWVAHFKNVAASGFAGRFLDEAEALGDLARNHLQARKMLGAFDEVMRPDGTMAFCRKPAPRAKVDPHRRRGN